VCLLWARLYPQKAAAHQHLSTYLSFLAACGVAAAEKAIKVQKQEHGGCEGVGSGDEGSGDEGSGDEGSDEGSGDEDTEDTFAQDMVFFLQAALAEKITEYINDHQDDAAQEDRWRTTMKREIMKRFREQREAIETQGQVISTQGEAIAEVRRAIDQQREATAEVHRLIVKIGNSLGLASAVGVTNQVGAETENLEC
jgi:hypothetical protein